MLMKNEKTRSNIVQNPQGLHAFCIAKRRARLMACQPCVSCTEPLGQIAEKEKHR